MTAAKYLIGDVYDVMATMDDGSVDIVLTSPPFLALRSYLPADHPDKNKEIGSEPAPAEFLDTLLSLTAEWRRLLAPHGSLCVELGDTYAGGGQGPDANHKGSERPVAATRGTGWPLDKSLCIIPELYAACLAYGRNVLTGEPSPAGQWRVRNLVRWVRPNPPVGALGDKFRPATSVMTVACQARNRWFDLDDVRTEHKWPEVARSHGRMGDDPNRRHNHGRDTYSTGGNPSGAPPLDWWNIPTEPYSGSHYATWPRKLCERPIRSMCPREVCRVCGEPRRRVVGEARYVRRDGVVLTEPERWESGVVEGMGAHAKKPGGTSKWRENDTLGWTDCGHGDDYRPGIVLDPFAGSGTTGAVATGLGRDFIGIDLDARNADLATERIGPLLIEVIDTREGAA